MYGRRANYPIFAAKLAHLIAGLVFSENNNPSSLFTMLACSLIGEDLFVRVFEIPRRGKPTRSRLFPLEILQ